MSVKELKAYMLKVEKLKSLIETLTFVDGYTLKEISSILGVSYRTILNWVHGKNYPSKSTIDYYIDVLRRIREGSLNIYDFSNYGYNDIIRTSLNPSFTFNGYSNIPKTKRVWKEIRKYGGKRVLKRIMKEVYGDVFLLNKALSYLTYYAGVLNVTEKPVLEFAGRILRKLFKEGKLNRREKVEYYPLASLRVALLLHGLAKKHPLNIELFGLSREKYLKYFVELAGKYLAEDR